MSYIRQNLYRGCLWKMVMKTCCNLILFYISNNACVLIISNWVNKCFKRTCLLNRATYLATSTLEGYHKHDILNVAVIPDLEKTKTKKNFKTAPLTSLMLLVKNTHAGLSVFPVAHTQAQSYTHKTQHGCEQRVRNLLRCRRWCLK